MTFQETLAAERKARGLSQEELAAKLNISRQAVSKWETGDSMPDLRNLLALAELFSLALDSLCGRTPPEAPEVQPPAPAKRGKALPILCIALAVLLVLTAVWGWRRGTPVPLADSGLLQTDFTVTGLNFSGISDTELGFQFVPGISGEAYTYQITFSNTHGDTIPMDVPCIGGVCSGQITLEGWGGGTVTVTVCDGVTSRHLAVAQSLSFSEGSASWHPLTD